MRLRPRREGEGSSRQREEDFDDEYVPDSYSDDSSDSGDKTKDFLRLLERSNGGHYVDDSDSHLGDDEPVMKRPKGKSKSKKSLKEDEDIWLGKQEPNVNGHKGIDAVVLEESFGVNQLHYNKKWKRKKREGPPLIWEIWEEENERWLDENMSKCYDLENQSEIMHSMAEPSSELIIPLLRYQKEWLAWALEREESTSRGGILADEMGMGKTIQAIALVLAKREILRAISGPSKPFLSPTTSTTLPEINCTLVICPVVAVMQWVGEIDRFTSKGSTKVLVYHGANRGKIVQQFADYDLVITTYSIVESEYRKNVLPPKEKCSWCGKLFYPEKMTIHLKYFCGPDAVRTEKQSKQTRKKAKHGPKTSKQKMESEDEGVKSKVGKRKGVSKKNNKKYSCEEEVTPSLGCLEGVQEGSSQKQSLLHSLKWERIILDEAHFIKDRRCSTAKSIFALHSSFKWALSGTPLQNRVGELYSLIRFLRINPYSFYLCKDCDCSILDYCSTKECSKCPHKSVRHFCWWNKYVATPIKENGSMVNGKRAMILLKDKVLKSIVLRRTKKGRAADLALPPTIISLRRDLLDIKEEDYYKSLYNESQAQFNTYVEAGTLMNNYAHIFDLLTRLRQAVDHPYLVVYSRTTALKNGSTIETDNNENVCGICHDTLEDPVVSSCEHAFCKACLIELSTDSEQVSCPSCSKPLTVDLTTKVGTICKNSRTAIKGFRSTSILNRIPLDDFQTSTKIEALREEIRFMFERDGSAKAIVFSQFTSFLDLINYSLQKSGVACVQLVGSMTMGAREDAIKKFTEDPDCRIFLMSLKAGGVALNLTVASHVFLMDPWWNPAVERQARDRIHRIGQYKPIRVVRFVIENTVEERILKLQDKKELVFEGTVGGSMEALGKLTEADMKFLFIT